VRNHQLTRLQPQLGPVQAHLDLVRLEGDHPGDTVDLGPGVLVGPRRAAAARHVVVAAQALVRAERLPVGRGQRGLVDVGPRDVPARREPRLEQGQRTGGVGDDQVTAAYGEVPAGLPDVDPVIHVGGVADDPLVFLVEGVHRPPRERDPPLQLAGVSGQVGVLPGRPLLARLAGPDREPGGRAEVLVPGRVLGGLEHAVGDVAEREVGHRVATGLVQQHDVFAIGDPRVREPDPHAPAQRLGVEQSFGKRVRDQEPADRSRCERSLLPS
jgi:hypothetical protein